MSSSAAKESSSADFLDGRKTLERVHAALNHAVRRKAENPLLHMARLLRSERQAEPKSISLIAGEWRFCSRMFSGLMSQWTIPIDLSWLST